MSDFDSWKELRMKLWPESTEVEHEEEMKIISSGACFDDELEWYVIIAYEEEQVIGFAETSLRESIEQDKGSPIAYLEGWYVSDNFRQRGIGKSLVTQVEKWAHERNCKYVASDVEYDNLVSLKAHKKLAFRVIDENDEGYILIKPIKE